ncbi:MAG: IS3 family transposase [Gemmatimonadaceae bacterium]|nr:IS3 family transposase [Gemmatimonadaceae bacterium]
MVSRVRAQYASNERKTCRWLGFDRTTMRYVPQRPLRDAALRAPLATLAAAHPRWGVPRLHWKLGREGVHVNYKRVERLYRLEGLAVRRRARKRLAVPRVPRPVVTQPNETWGIDFVSDQLSSGRRVRVFTVVDHCTKESPGLAVAHSLPSVAVIDALEAMIAAHGQPARLSLDNGSEFRSRAFDAWAADRGIELCFIQPGKPIQNCFIESFNSRVRDECLNAHWFVSLEAAQFHVERWRREYNTARPHESCYPLTPTEYAQTFTPSPTGLGPCFLLQRGSRFDRRMDWGQTPGREEAPCGRASSRRSRSCRRSGRSKPARSLGRSAGNSA